MENSFKKSLVLVSVTVLHISYLYAAEGHIVHESVHESAAYHEPIDRHTGVRRAEEAREVAQEAKSSEEARRESFSTKTGSPAESKSGSRPSSPGMSEDGFSVGSFEGVDSGVHVGLDFGDKASSLTRSSSEAFALHEKLVDLLSKQENSGFSLEQVLQHAEEYPSYYDGADKHDIVAAYIDAQGGSKAFISSEINKGTSLTRLIDMVDEYPEIATGISLDSIINEFYEVQGQGKPTERAMASYLVEDLRNFNMHSLSEMSPRAALDIVSVARELTSDVLSSTKLKGKLSGSFVANPGDVRSQATLQDAVDYIEQEFVKGRNSGDSSLYRSLSDSQRQQMSKMLNFN